MKRLLCAFLVLLITVPAIAATKTWTARETWIQKREIGLQRMFVHYELDKAYTPPGATIPKHKSLVIPYEKNRVFELAKKAKKAAAVNLAMIAAVEAVGWAMDELTKEVTEVTVINHPADNYYPGKYYATSSVTYPAQTPQLSCTGKAGSGSYITEQGLMWVNGTQYPAFNCYAQGGQFNGTIQPFACGSNQNTYCTVAPEGYEEEQVALVPDPLVIDQVMPYLDGLPDFSLDDIFEDERGIPIITPELQDAIDDYNQDLADADPNLTYDAGTGTFTYTDPDTMETTDFDGKPDTTENTDTTGSDQQPNGADWPDFCDWTSGAGFCETQPQEQPDYQPVLDKYQEANDGVGSMDAPLPDLPVWPVGFGGGETCPGVTVEVSEIGYSSNVMTKACELAIQYVNPFFTWFFALLAAWYCWTVFREETTRSF